MAALGLLFALIYLFGICFCQDLCKIDIDCDDCLPEYLPLISPHSSIGSVFHVQHGDEVQFDCRQSKFIAYPDKNVIKATCENGQFRVKEDNLIMTHFSNLGCQVEHFEDISHEVEFCSNPFQGRSYQHQNATTFHLAEICYDTDLGQTVFTHMVISADNNIIKHPHIDDRMKISILGNFNLMIEKSTKIEAEKVYINEITMNKKIKNVLEQRKFYFGGQSFAVTKLLPNKFFNYQNGRVTKFISNKVAIWKSIADGNLKNLQNDIVEGFKRNSLNNNQSIDIYTGTHNILSLHVDDQQQDIYLKPGNKYPVPKYFWSIVYDKSSRKAVSIIIINNPFISISEIRQTVFCPSLCNAINWINHLKHGNNYERSAYGLVFCCDLQSFARTVKHAPNLLPNVHAGERGILKDSLPY